MLLSQQFRGWGHPRYKKIQRSFSGGHRMLNSHCRVESRLCKKTIAFLPGGDLVITCRASFCYNAAESVERFMGRGIAPRRQV